MIQFELEWNSPWQELRLVYNSLEGRRLLISELAVKIRKRNAYSLAHLWVVGWVTGRTN